MDHHVTDGIHKSSVAVNLGLRVKVLRKDEMQVPFQRMPKDNGLVILILFKQLVQVNHTLCQMLNREGHIFNNHRCACFAHRPHQREQAFTDPPIACAHRWIFGKLNRMHGLDMSNRSCHLSDQTGEFVVRFPAHLNQQGCCIRWQVF